MPSHSDRFLARIFPCLNDGDKNPEDSTKLMAENYIPSWQRQRDEQRRNQQTLEPQTGLRRRGQSQSQVQQHRPSSTSTSDERRKSQQDEPSGNEMLYFGQGVSPDQAMKTYTAGPKPRTHTSRPTGGKGGGGRISGSGRDASGYLQTGVNNTSIMAGTYSALTYGGSTQYNFSGTQSYDAGP